MVHTKFQARQGDVFVERIEAIPVNAKLVKRDGDVILARGEATGHAHRIAAPEAAVDVLQEAERIILNVRQRSVLVHEEHRSIVLEPGIYASWIQREFDDLEAERRVAD